MEYLSKHFKEAGYYNVALSVITIAVEIFSFFNPNTGFIEKLLYLFSTVAVIFGLFYAFSGYKKNATKYYKIYMWLFVLCSLISVVGDFIYVIANYGKIDFSAVLNAVKLIGVIMLAVIPDFGEKKSSITIFAVLIISVVILVRGLFIIEDDLLPFLSASLADTLLACLACMFIAAKYKDKSERGTK